MFLWLSLQVFLPVGPPGPAHEEAHLKKSGRGEEARGGNRRRSRRRDRRRERDGQSSYQPPASFTPSITQLAAMTPAGQRIHLRGALKIKGTDGPLIGDGGRRGIARLLFFFKITHSHICNSEHTAHPSSNASSRWTPAALTRLRGLGHCQTNIYLTCLMEHNRLFSFSVVSVLQP